MSGPLALLVTSRLLILPSVISAHDSASKQERGYDEQYMVTANGRVWETCIEDNSADSFKCPTSACTVDCVVLAAVKITIRNKERSKR